MNGRGWAATIRCQKCWDGTPHEYKHGRTGYIYHRCRCVVCVKAADDYTKAYRKSGQSYLAKDSCLDADCRRPVVREGLCARHLSIEGSFT